MELNLCRCCGKPLKKHTTTVTFRPKPGQYDHPTSYHKYAYFGEHRPQTVEEAQRYINAGEIVAVSRETEWRDGVLTDLGIRQVSVWDGVSYKDKHFCTNGCAIAFARSYAAHGYACDAWRVAVTAARKSKERTA